MKSAIVSMILLAAVIAVCVICNLMIDERIGEIIEAADSLPGDTDDKDEIKSTLNDIERLWKKYRAIASIGAANAHIEKIDKDLIRIRTYSKAKQNGGYNAAVDILKYDLRNLSDIYRFRLANVY